MDTATKQVMDLMDVLTENERNSVLEFIQNLAYAWNPDITGFTPATQSELEKYDHLSQSY